tara:strand:+ start:426 stop:1412 length:987 start_codon:yes stop_codon:yes gene_type:complete
MGASIRGVWDRLRTPDETQGLAAAHVRGTNCWVFKDHEGSLGFLMSGVMEPSRFPQLENIDILFVPEKNLHDGDSVMSLRRCLQIHLDPSCDAELLAAILDRMADHEPSGTYSTELMLTVIEQVANLVRRPPRPPSKEEVIGAWGELMILLRALGNSPDHMELQRRINCWEAEGSARDIIDFRFPHIDGGIAIEAKTSSTGRVHHINGMGQVTVPEGFERGLLASIRIRETDGTSGHTAADLVNLIKETFSRDEDVRSEQSKALHSKLTMRGICCYDERFAFVLPADGIRLFDMENVPSPSTTTDVTEVEWVSDLSQTPHADALHFIG